MTNVNPVSGWLKVRRGLHVGASVAALTSLFFSPVAMAGPEGGQVRGGEATIIDVGGGRTNILQQTQNVSIDWTSFNIAPGEHVDFQQPNSTSTALNRVTGGSLSEIFGLLTSNGIVLIVNPNGVVFSETARVDVGGLVATTSNISDANFMAGNYAFEAVPGAEASRIINRGLISAADGGLVALVAPGVENSGVISARLGRVALASGEQYTLDLYGDNLINFAGDAGQIGQLYGTDGEPISLVDSSGTIAADGGTVFLFAADAAGLIDNAISVTGVVEANTVSEQNGEIILSANGGIDVSGSLAARGDDSGETGGAIDLFGDSVVVSGDIDASGDSGGGYVRIGGDLHGEGAATASTTTVTDTATVSADALTTGDGGTIVIWADGDTYYAGTTSAMGGMQSGDGGFVEVSGRARLVFDGSVDATAANGIGGTLLLDPTDVVIEANGGNDVAEGSSVSANAINDMLRSGMSVIIDADNSITVNQQIDGRPLDDSIMGRGSGLTLQAGNSVFIFRPVITDDGAIVVTAGAGGITIQGQGFLAVAEGVSGAGDANITLTAGGDISATDLLTLGDISITSTSGAVAITSGLFGLNVDGAGQGIGSLDISAATTVDLAGARSVAGGITVAGNAVRNTVDSLIAENGGVTLNGGAGGVSVSSREATVIDASGSVDIDASTAVALNGAVNAGGDVTIDTGTSGAVTLRGDVLSGGLIRIGAEGAEVGSLTADDDDNPLTTNGARVLQAAGTVTIDSVGDVNVGNIVAGNTSAVDVESTAGAITTGGIFGAAANTGVGSINLNSATGVTTHTASLIADNGNITLDGGTGGVSVSGGTTAVEASGDVSIDAQGDVTSAGAIEAGGSLRVGADLGRVASFSTGTSDLVSGGDVTVWSNGDVTVGDVGGAVDGSVSITSTAGNITTLGIFGADGADTDGDGVGEVTLNAGGSVNLAGAQANGGGTSSGNISITAVSGVTNTTDSLIAVNNVSLDGGSGGVSVSGGTTVIDASGSVDIDASTAVALNGAVNAGGDVTIDTDTSGAVTLRGDVLSGGLIRIGAEGAEVGSLTADDDDNATTTTDAHVLQAAGTVTIDSVGDVNVGNIVAGNASAVDVESTTGAIAAGGIFGAAANTGVGSINLDSATGVTTHTASLIADNGGVTLNGGTGAVSVSGGTTVIEAGGTGAVVDIDAGTAVALNGAVNAGGDVTIDTGTSGAVTLRGDVLSGGLIRIGAEGAEVGSLTADDDDSAVTTTDAHVLQAAGTVTIDSVGSVNVGNIVAGNNSAVDVESTAGTITTGGIFGAAASSGVGSINLDSATGVTTHTASLIADNGGVTLNGGTGAVSVNGGVIQSQGTIDLDSNGAIVLSGGATSQAGEILIGSATNRVSSVSSGGLRAASNVDVSSTGDVTVSGIQGGEGASDSVNVDAGGTIRVGSIRGTSSTLNGDGVGSGATAVNLVSTGGDIFTNGIDAGAGGITIDADSNLIEINGALQSAGAISIGKPNCALDGSCPEVYLNHNVFTEGGAVVFDANVTMFQGFERVPLWFRRDTNGAFVLDANGNLIAEIEPPDPFNPEPADVTGVIRSDGDGGGAVISSFGLDGDGHVVALPSDIYLPVDLASNPADLDPGPSNFTGCNFSNDICFLLGLRATPDDTNLTVDDRVDFFPIGGLESLDRFDEFFAYTESNFLIGGETIVGTDYPNSLSAYAENDSTGCIDNFCFVDGPGENTTEQIYARIASLADMFGQARLTIDTTQNNNAGGANITFNGSLLRYEGNAVGLSAGDLPVVVTQQEVGVLDSYVNQALYIDHGNGTSQVFFNGAVGSSSDATLALTQGVFGQPVATPPPPGVEAPFLEDHLILGTFDLVFESASGDAIFNQDTQVRLNEYIEPCIGCTDGSVDDYGVQIKFNYIGTQGQRAGPDGSSGAYGGSPNIGVPPVTGGNGTTGGSGSSGAGASGGVGSFGSGASDGSGSSGSGANPGTAQGGSGAPPLGAPPAPGGDSLSNLDETQKEQDETPIDDQEQEDNTCPKGPRDYADYGNALAQSGTTGNVFRKCEEDVLAAADR